MNEYLEKPGSTWGDPNFTDIFPPTSDESNNYRDSPLSEKGLAQAKQLSERFLSLMEDQKLSVSEVEIVAISPLNRALQTFEIGVLPHLGVLEQQSTKIPIVALPLATERLYLISDLGSSASTLSKRYPFVDCTTEFRDGNDEEWWFKPTAASTDDNDDTNYIEWRPIDQNQKYACPGEPDLAFNTRMRKLYDWIEAREESTICIVCHWGVLEWLTGERFDNCEMRVVQFDDLKCFDSDTSIS